MRRALGGHLTGRTAVLVALETLLIVGSVVLATYIRLRQWPWEEVTEGGGDLVKALIIALVCQLSLYWLDLYDLRVVAERREMFVRLVRALGVTALTLAAIYFWFPALVIGRGVFVIAAVLALTSITAWRLAFEWLTHRVSPRERLLLVGTSPAAIDLARELHERRAELGVEIAGFVDADPARVGAPVINPGIIGTIEDIPAIVRARSVDRVVVSLADARGKLPMDKLLEMKLEGVTFDHLPSVYEEYTGKIAVESLRPSWLIFSRGFRKSNVLQAAKRTLDIVAAAIGLVLHLPLMLADRGCRQVDIAWTRPLPAAARWTIRAALHRIQVPVDVPGRGGPRPVPCGLPRTTSGSPRSAASCVEPGSTSCRSSGTC